MSRKFSVTYNFKTLTTVLFAALLADRAETEEQKALIQAQFEAIPDGETKNADNSTTPKYKYKRRPVTVELDLPDELETLEASTTPVHASLITNAVTRVITEFVKSQYVDDFATVGAHDLDTIATVQAQSGGRNVGFTFSDATLADAVKSFQIFLVHAINNTTVAASVATAAKSRFTRSAITRAVGLYNEDILTKLQGRVDQWGLWLNDNDPENADEFAAVHSCWSATISKQLKADASVDISAIL